MNGPQSGRLEYSLLRFPASLMCSQDDQPIIFTHPRLGGNAVVVCQSADLVERCKRLPQFTTAKPLTVDMAKLADMLDAVSNRADTLIANVADIGDPLDYDIAAFTDYLRRELHRQSGETRRPG